MVNIPFQVQINCFVKCQIISLQFRTGYLPCRYTISLEFSIFNKFSNKHGKYPVSPYYDDTVTDYARFNFLKYTIFQMFIIIATYVNVNDPYGTKTVATKHKTKLF